VPSDPRRQRFLSDEPTIPALALARCRPAHGTADPALAGPIQRANAAAAIAALRALDSRCRARRGAGIAAARMAGRLQAFERDGVQIRVDVGHNPQAAGQLAAGWPSGGGRTLAVYAALQDKDAVGVVQACTRIDGWWLAGLDGPRGQGVDALRTPGRDRGRNGRAPCRRVGALAQALARPGGRPRPGVRLLPYRRAALNALPFRPVRPPPRAAPYNRPAIRRLACLPWIRL
jgi:hypothetical protein